MKILEYYLENKKRYGNVGAIKKTIQHAIQKIIGTDKYEVQLVKQKEEVDTLYYFLNTFVSIESIKPAKGDLRKLQECDVLLLSILDKICEKYKLSYFMGWGTLLGAKRHKGFIPWDDDTDICMLREDYDRALNVLPGVFKELGFDVHVDNKLPLASIGIGYKHYQTGIWVDIFPFDCYKWNEKCNCSKNLEAEIAEYRKEYLELKKKNASLERVLNKKNNILTGLSMLKEANVLFYNTEFDGKIKIFDKEKIFPLKKEKFENILLSAPCDIDKVLEIMYGKDYMKFPHGGVEHHGNGIDVLSNWAILSGTNMDEVKKELESIRESLNE